MYKGLIRKYFITTDEESGYIPKTNQYELPSFNMKRCYGKSDSFIECPENNVSWTISSNIDLIENTFQYPVSRQ